MDVFIQSMAPRLISPENEEGELDWEEYEEEYEEEHETSPPFPRNGLLYKP